MRKLKSPRIIKIFRDGHKLIFSRGKFDNYMVSITRDSCNRYSGWGLDYGFSPMAPTDKWLFYRLRGLGNGERIMSAILFIAGQIDNHTSNLNNVTIPHETLIEEKLLSILAAMMLAEEKKDNTCLGKMIKVLGCWQLLMEGFTPEQAASWSSGRPADDIKERIQEYELQKRTMAVVPL